MLGQGRILADDTSAAIRDLVGVRRVSLTATSLPPLSGVTSQSTVDGRTDLLTTDSDRLVRELVTSGADVLRPGDPTDLPGGGVPRPDLGT